MRWISEANTIRLYNGRHLLANNKLILFVYKAEGWRMQASDDVLFGAEPR